jgi:hypothetical protein
MSFVCAAFRKEARPFFHIAAELPGLRCVFSNRYCHLRRRRGAAPSSNSNSGGIEQAHAELKRAIEHLQELMPDATVTVTITYRGQ